MAFLDECLHLSFFQTQRFHLLERERIDEVMHELGLQSGGLVDMTTGPKLGKLLAAEVLLMGSMQETWDGQDRCLGVIARLVEVETGRILAINSVYNPWENKQDEEYLLSGLAHIFQQDFPLLQGKVMDKYRQALEINLGANDLIKEGMKVLVYHPVENNQSILGEARVVKVVKDFSHASPSPKELLKIFEVGNLVITK